MIDLPRLIACGIGPSTARVFEAPLSIACVQFGIASVEQQAGFIAQVMHESRDFTHLEESLSYRSVETIRAAFKRLRTLPAAELQTLVRNPKGLAKAAYSNINGNGGPETTDSWEFRGSGPVQLTGRGNFQTVVQRGIKDKRRDAKHQRQAVTAELQLGKLKLVL